jgi:gliding motility-associated-like protein
MVFKVTDDNSIVQLVDFETFEIKVIAPAPENLEAEPQGNNIILDWDPGFCPDISGYKIYRKIDSLGYAPDSCQTGAPPGYSLIGTLQGSGVTAYTDNDNLVHGQKYCYVVVACFPNGAVSQASLEACAELKKDVPIITHVTVNVTDTQNGEDSIIWSKPTELDTNQFPGPYKYRVLRQLGFSGANVEIYSSPLTTFLYELDTIITNGSINTKDTAWNYNVELYYSTNQLVGNSNDASSVYLDSDPSDNLLNLRWEEKVPWTNTEYVVLKETTPGTFTILDTVGSSSYTDFGLVNGVEYCYYVKSIGAYSTSGLIDPIVNRSQIHCNIPVDNVPPCFPDSVVVTGDCDVSENLIQWSNPVTTGCADDVVGYNIYFTPIFDGEYTLIQTNLNSTDTFLIHDSISSIAGCYAITAFDTVLNQSLFSDTVCVDNCPIYELPNVISPGGDGFNDLLRPFPYRFIESIDLRVYNRWGETVFKSLDPDILWDGRHSKSGNQVTDGVYYYTCDVFEIRLTGIEKRSIKGYFHVISEASGGSGSE